MRTRIFIRNTVLFALNLHNQKKHSCFLITIMIKGRMGFAKSPAVTRIERKFRLLDPDTLEQEFKIKPKKKIKIGLTQIIENAFSIVNISIGTITNNENS